MSVEEGERERVDTGEAEKGPEPIPSPDPGSPGWHQGISEHLVPGHCPLPFETLHLPCSSREALYLWEVGLRPEDEGFPKPQMHVLKTRPLARLALLLAA